MPSGTNELPGKLAPNVKCALPFGPPPTEMNPLPLVDGPAGRTRPRTSLAPAGSVKAREIDALALPDTSAMGLAAPLGFSKPARVVRHEAFANDFAASLMAYAMLLHCDLRASACMRRWAAGSMTGSGAP